MTPASEVTLGQLRQRGMVGAVLGLLGPAFVASVAYVDPGNFATDFAGGAAHGYQLAWVIVLADLMAILVQYITSKAGLATGRSLPELCGQRFSRRVNVVLWTQAELVAMATDLAEFVGTALGLHLVFGIPPLPAGLFTAVVTVALLELRRRGRRGFELAVVGLLGLVAAGFGYLFFAAGGQDYAHLAAGLVPDLRGTDTAALAVGIVGATVMPHVVYLHSALQTGRVVATDREERRILLTYNKWDCVAGLGVVGLVNLAMLCVAAALFRQHGTTVAGDLESIHAHLATMVGGGAALAFGIALIASGVSSSGVGTYAGEVIMAGFLKLHVPLPVRRAVTMLPSLVVLGLGVDPSRVLVASQIVLSFGIPFALVPLLLVTRDRSVMAEAVNNRFTDLALTVVTVLVTGMNGYLLWRAFGPA